MKEVTLVKEIALRKRRIERLQKKVDHFLALISQDDGSKHRRAHRLKIKVDAIKASIADQNKRLHRHQEMLQARKEAQAKAS